MTLTPDQFRADFPEFGDATVYADAPVNAWLGAAAAFVNADRWGALAALGTELVAAHFLVLAGRDASAAAAGLAPGEVKGLKTSQSVSDVSASYDVSALVGEGDGFWNATSYGLRYRRLARVFGAGGVQLGSFCF